MINEYMCDVSSVPKNTEIIIINKNNIIDIEKKKKLILCTLAPLHIYIYKVSLRIECGYFILIAVLISWLLYGLESALISYLLQVSAAVR